MPYITRFYIGLNNDKDGAVAPEEIDARIALAKSRPLQYASGMTICPAQGVWEAPESHKIITEDSIVIEVVTIGYLPANSLATYLRDAFNQKEVLYTQQEAEAHSVWV